MGPVTPCDQTGVPNSVLTHPRKLGADAVLSEKLVDVDAEHVAQELRRCWGRRDRSEGDGPIWSRTSHGAVEFDFEVPVEASWRWQRDDSESGGAGKNGGLGAVPHIHGEVRLRPPTCVTCAGEEEEEEESGEKLSGRTLLGLRIASGDPAPRPIFEEGHLFFQLPPWPSSLRARGHFSIITRPS
ncbi:unnamed protein product [Prorocentrum cordatum]|uniref:Uncharacterized protein n=1 Tax=Prorocentrum cordatum TaxID=2364126 RepID=A0ABN9SRB5_9DINO|nr:unnamed protein product [Polarella glacialis]